MLIALLASESRHPSTLPFLIKGVKTLVDVMKYIIYSKVILWFGDKKVTEIYEDPWEQLDIINRLWAHSSEYLIDFIHYIVC